ncbi:dihydroorotate dehydrogenase electron transfer subunit [Sinanaerobacter chloroacetimidivorans]|uniref:Dihydroorotate dehydrogenase B (NAD(+)), electron transfer subunit n=1 Tax=Sinanaerobacter chloroacetimidivorans TaxID=2818044 RepID=A0A8J7W3Y3_9FIRM|nr:dihydroorotate dehydrogenase electron transfer subunit [Sinanaerobacter chloroacetimidivorans]MBR0598785.1 dihydroorotate dehydrogenase electron transfer subunit [Sinanaerobacter chloroacetimidivorans]
MMKKILNGRVVENIEIADKVYRLVVNAPEAVRDYVPGRFVNVYLKDKSLLLPRPVSISETNGENMALIYGVVGKGTSEIAQYDMGDRIRISTPLGNGYQIGSLLQKMKRDHAMQDGAKAGVIGLVGGGIGVPPLLGLAKAIRKMQREAADDDKSNLEFRNLKTVAVLGFQREPFLEEELKEYCDEVLIATDEGNFGFHGNVLDLIGQNQIHADGYFACGPKPMLKALSTYCRERQIPVQISMEERMGCGYGACVGCVCKTQEKTDEGIAVAAKKVCKDGPVFYGDEVIWDEE